MLLILFEIFVNMCKVAAIVDLNINWLKQREFADIISINKKLITCSRHQKTNSPILQFTNLKCCKMSLKSKNKELISTPLKGVLKDSLAFIKHFKFVNWRIGEFVF